MLFPRVTKDNRQDMHNTYRHRTLSLILSSNPKSKTTLAANGSLTRLIFARFWDISSSESCSPAAILSALFLFFSFFAAFSFARRSSFRSSILAILSALFCAFFETTTASDVFSDEVDLLSIVVESSRPEIEMRWTLRTVARLSDRTFALPHVSSTSFSLRLLSYVCNS